MENKLEKPPVWVCGCDVDGAPREGKALVDVGFAPPSALPNRLPPNPPVLAGCAVLDGALEVFPPRLPNKLGVVPVDVLVAAPNSGLIAGVPDAGAPLEAGCEPPRLPNSDMALSVLAAAVLIVLKTSIAFTNYGRGAWTTIEPCPPGTNC